MLAYEQRANKLIIANPHRFVIISINNADQEHDPGHTPGRVRLPPKGRLIGADRFIPTPDPVIKIVLEAVLKLIDVAKPTAKTARIVQAAKPRPSVESALATSFLIGQPLKGLKHE